MRLGVRRFPIHGRASEAARATSLEAAGRSLHPASFQASRYVRPDRSQTAFEGQLLGISIETWGPHLREIVEHPGAVAIVAVDRKDHLILVRQLREPARRTLIELPAGTMESGEEPLATAQRELLEETGLGGGLWRAGPVFYSSPGFCRERIHLFFADSVEEGEAGEAAVAGDESIEVVRWPIAEIGKHLAEVEDAKTLVGLLLYLRSRDRGGTD